MADKVGMPDDGRSWLRWLADSERREYGEFLADQDPRNAREQYEAYREWVEGQ